MTIQKKNLVFAFVAAISLVIILSIFSYDRINAFIDSAASVNHTTQVTLELEKFKGALRDAETAKRGYLLTHDAMFLDAFTKALREYPQHIKTVKELIFDNPEQQKSLARVEQLAKNRDDYFNKMLEVDKSRPVAPDEYLMGQAIMDSLVTEVNTMVLHENRLLDQRSSELLKQSLYAPILLLITSLIALAVLIFSYLKLNKSLVQEHTIKAEGFLKTLSDEKLKNENRFRDMVEQAPVAICLLRGKDFVVEIANKKQLQSWDRTREQMLNCPIFKDVPQEQVQGLIDMLNGVMATGEPFIATEMPSIQVRDGIERTVYVNFICEPFYKDGEIDGIMAVSTDVTEQVLDRKRVEESESKFRSLIDAAPIGIGVFRGRDLIIENPNREMIDIMGKGPDIIGKRLIDAMPELLESGKSYLKILDEVFTSGKRYQSFGDPVNIVKDGVLKAGFYDINYIPLFNSENQVYAILDIATDVTERVEATKKIQESEQRFQNLVRDASVGIVVLTGEEMKVEIVNEGYSRLFNLNPSDLLHQNLFEIIPDTEAFYRPFLSGVMQSGKPVHLNESPYSVEIKGELIEGFLNVVYQPYRNSDEGIIGVMVLCVDVTQQVMAKIKIEESEQRFQAAVKAVRGILWTNNSRGEMEGQQIGWSTLTGQTYEEYQGFGWADAVHPDDAQPTVEAWEKALKHQTIFDFEHRLKIKNGNYRNFSIRAIPLFNSDGTIRQWVGVHTDITEQKEAAQKIKESESYFRRLTDTVPAIIWITEPDGSCSYLNKLWYDYTGQSKYEALGFGWLEAIHPDDKEKAGEVFITANDSQKPFSHLSRFRNSNGDYRWAVDSGSPKFDADGVFEGMIGTVIDVHEEKLAEEKLAYRTALLEAHNQASVDGISLVDAKGKILSYNQRFLEIWNMPSDILEANDYDAAFSFAIEQLINPEQFIEKVKNRYTNPHETVLDILEFKNGKIVERNGYPVIGNDGIYYAWNWTFRDVTRQKEIEKEIRESEERFRSLAQTLPQLVWVADAHGNQEFASLKWEEYSGIEPSGEAEWKAIVHPEDYDRINSVWAYSLATGVTYQAEVRLRNRNGDFRWHAVKGEPLLDQYNNITKWVGAFTDINEQKLNDERKDEFVSIASHEMKTPLTTAKAYLQMLELTLDESDEEAYLFTKKANQSVDRLTELVTELLDVSKIRLGKLHYNLGTFNFNEMIQETVESIQLTSSSHKIIKAGKVCDQVYGDKDRLQQVVVNLLTNAIKYSPGAEEVYITIYQQHDSIQVSVQDFGIGIAETSLNKIFDKYHRIEEHAVHFQGLGIGLFISYEIIQRHSGNLWAKSESGKGSTFYFSIPINNTSLQ